MSHTEHWGFASSCLVGWLLLLTACGGSSDSNKASDSASSGGSSSAGGTGAGGTASTTTSNTSDGGTSAGGSSGTPTTSSTTSAGGTEPTEPLDPSIFDPQEPTEPRTDGDRVKPGPRVDCPEEEPTAGDECDQQGLACTYGDKANWACRAEFRCEMDEWVRYGGACAVPSDDYCTDEPEPGLACPGPQGTCEFDSMICYCPACDRFQPCDPPGQPRWICITPPVDLDCPLLPPNLGEGCDKQAHRCVYGNPCVGNGVIVFCRDGAWEEEPAACQD